ncbi:alpha/beta hydrolase [Liquorilactobacillus satsumensis]|uniref:alpha/beta hydrolase n=1 Tax=Liquorilactobacillus satsumensis TaxID=259059 RepID=UPI0039ECA8CE
MKNKNIIVESLAVAAAATGLASEYLFKKAFARVDYVPETSDAKQKYATKYWECVDWFKKKPKEHWTFGIPGETEQMSAYYLPATTESQQVVIISHGYKGNGETMANYARMFSQMGFNVLLPDDRGHGESAGKYISFGWLDRLDYLKWIQKINARIGVNAQILLFGVSMGAATVAMLTGESLPPQVKCTIADCGYSSIDEELTYLLKQQFHLPRYPFYPLVSTINHHRLGYYLHSVSTTAQLKKNTKPIFFIHGEKDAYVPVKMAYENYYATSAPKELWIVKDATHAESFWKDPESYQRHLNKFLERYYYENPKNGVESNED